MERASLRKGGTALAILAVAAVSLLSPKDGGLWQGLASSSSPLEPGWLGLLLWQGFYNAFGMAGVYLIRAVLAALLALAIFRLRPNSEPSIKGTLGALTPSANPDRLPTQPGTGTKSLENPASFLGRLACAACLALLLPWGPNALFFGMTALVLELSERSLLLAFLAALAWPLFDGSFLAGGFICVLTARAPIKKSWAIAVAPLLNPIGAAAVVSGQAFLPFAASWCGYAGYAPPMPSSPSFYLAALWGVACVAASFRDIRLLSASSLAVFLGMALRPLSSLPAFIRPRISAKEPRAGIFLLLLPFAAWLVARGPAESLPAQASNLLSGIPPGGWTLQSEPEWNSELAFHLGFKKVVPRFETPQIWVARDRYPGGLVPPFTGSPRPDADILLVKPRYPKDPFPQRLLPGWSLISVGTKYALFARQTPALREWIREHRLAFYDPYSILPDDAPSRRKALDDALRVLDDDPEFFQALRDAGRMESDFQLAAAATSHLKKALKIEPRNAELWNDLGAAMQIGGDQNGAFQAYGRSLDLNPSELLPRFNLASLLLQAGRPEEAETVLRAVIAARPRAYIAYRRLAQVLVSQGRGDEARKVLDEIPPDMRSPEDSAILGGTYGSGMTP